MVVKISYGSSLYGALSYNGEKVNEGVARILETNKVFCPADGGHDITASSLRGQLYTAAMASLRCNAECKACFDRLRSNGKPGKVAVVAVANKLVRQAFAVVTQEKPYVDGFKSAKS